MNGWRVINSAKIVQDTSNPCKTGILVDNKVYPLGGAADYAQNDPAADGYIKNRPFYEETEKVTFLEPHTFEMNSSNGWAQLPFTNTDKIVPGVVLTVLWDGEPYECAVHLYRQQLVVGNESLDLPTLADTGEPFLIVFNFPTYYMYVAETGTHTISAICYESVPKKIDPKYIPEWNELENVPFSEKTVETSIEGMTFGEFTRSTSAVSHGFDIPFALGQVWKVTFMYGGSTSAGSIDDLEVRQADDGTLYIGGYPNVQAAQLYITPEHICCNEQWVRVCSYPYEIKLIGVSGTFTETEVKKIDAKYLPDAEKPVVVFRQDAEGNALVETDVEDLFTYLMTSAKDGLVPKCIYKGSNEVVPITSIMYDNVEGAVFCYFAHYPALDFSAYMFGVLSTGEVAYSPA